MHPHAKGSQVLSSLSHHLQRPIGWQNMSQNLEIDSCVAASGALPRTRAHLRGDPSALAGAVVLNHLPELEAALATPNASRQPIEMGVFVGRHGRGASCQWVVRGCVS